MATELEAFERTHPLWGFSPYLWGRIRVLLALSQEILADLDCAFSSDLRMEELARAEANLWLWCLGAYEMVRTMTQEQALACFSLRLREPLRELKRQLKEVRMPAAKMELKRSKGSRFGPPVTSCRAPADIDVESMDLLVGDPDRPVSGRSLLSRFGTVLASIEPEDVIDRHESGYDARKAV
ncbi:MAG TPA: hypothetical protein VFE33_30680 [Thermoanaerobaculia bacterium]|nr:hypothetical protein [Thermoanaerobaculia bacterium]